MDFFKYTVDINKCIYVYIYIYIYIYINIYIYIYINIYIYIYIDISYSKKLMTLDLFALSKTSYFAIRSEGGILTIF